MSGPADPRLLFDQNLSYRLPGLLTDLFPGSAHVREFGLEAASDTAVWKLAASEGFVIVSKDNDFHQRSFALGFPPKVVWLRLGNCSTSSVLDLLRERHADVVSFARDKVASFLALSSRVAPPGVISGR